MRRRHEEPSAATVAPLALESASPPPVPRRYALARALLPRVEPPAALAASQAPTPPVGPAAPGGPPALASLPRQPPAGAPTVRISPPPPRPAAPVAEALLAQTAQMALLRTSPDGSLSFDIAFGETAFGDLACTITLQAGHTQATFRVTDPNARRLLEAEAGRLRVGLQARGLKVDSVTVIES